MASTVFNKPSEGVVAVAKQAHAERRGFFAGIIMFLKQVVSEIRKVVAPTRKELINFTVIVLVFVIIMMTLVYGVDHLFAWLVTLVFGSGF